MVTIEIRVSQPTEEVGDGPDQMMERFSFPMLSLLEVEQAIDPVLDSLWSSNNKKLAQAKSQG